MANDTHWLALGLAGQALFSARFILQWASSERVGRSVIPVTFWYLSTAGGVVLLVYAVGMRDPVFVIGQASGLVVYLRNLWMINRNGRESEVEKTAGV